MDEFDVVIIGAGVAGSLIADKLADKFKVLLIDAGESGPTRDVLVKNFMESSRKTPGSPYKGGDGDIYSPSPDFLGDYYDQDDSRQKFKSTYQRRVGGTTWHWLGNTPRLLPSDFKMKTLFDVAVDWPIGYEVLEKWYCEAESELGVSGDHNEWDGLFGAYRSKDYPMPKIPLSYSDKLLSPSINNVNIDGKKLKVRSTPQARNSITNKGNPACMGSSSCVPICPIGAKYDATRHVDSAKDKGAKLIEKAVVTSLEIDGEQKIKTVTFKRWDGTENKIAGKIVVIAAHAIESAKILLLSGNSEGISNSSGMVGCNLMDHPGGTGGAMLPLNVYPFRGPPTTSGIDEFRDGNFRSHTGAFRLSLGNDGWGRAKSPGDVLQDLLHHEVWDDLYSELRQRTNKMFRISYSTEMLPNVQNRVTLSSKRDCLYIPRPKINFSLDQYSYNAIAHSRMVIKRIFNSLGATTISISNNPHEYSGAGHIMGTCMMGKSAKYSVVDEYCRSHDHKNLFIVGSSVFPSCGTANPTLTIAALSLRAADTISTQLINSA